jgi:predicted regulator of Ras-like GTPase activity (Roadblock/LC7/MglB family)
MEVNNGKREVTMHGVQHGIQRSAQATRTERINESLRGLRMVSVDIIGAAVINMDGFIIASVLPTEVDEELIGGMAASILGVGERIAADLMRAEMEQVYVRSPKGYVIVNAISEDAALILLVTREAKLGLIFLELKRSVNELLRIMS